jgi:hypothetical protein
MEAIESKKKLTASERYLLNPKCCEHCDTQLTYRQVLTSMGRFCSQKCSQLALPPPRAHENYRPPHYKGRTKRDEYRESPVLCKNCQNPLTYEQYYKDQNQFCSRHCFYTGRKGSEVAYEAAPQPCAHCGGALTYKQHAAGQRFCSLTCSHSHSRAIDAAPRKEAPTRIDHSIEVAPAAQAPTDCSWCSAPLNRLQVQRGGRFCSGECRHRAWREKAKRERAKVTAHSEAEYLKAPLNCVVCGDQLLWTAVSKYSLRYCGNECRGHAMVGKGTLSGRSPAYVEGTADGAAHAQDLIPSAIQRRCA